MGERTKQQFGKWGEQVAAWHLEKKGFHIIETHHTSRFGEIDIIAQEEGQVVFIEVKTRSSARSGLPEDSFTRGKAQRMRRAVLAYISKKRIENFRIDVVAIDCGLHVDKVVIRHHRAVSDIFQR